MAVRSCVRVFVLSILTVVVVCTVAGSVNATVLKRGEQQQQEAVLAVGAESRNPNVSTHVLKPAQRVSREEALANGFQPGHDEHGRSWNMTVHIGDHPDQWYWFCDCGGCRRYFCGSEYSYAFCCCDFHDHEDPFRHDKECFGCHWDECRGDRHPYPDWPPHHRTHKDNSHNDNDSNNNNNDNHHHG